MFIKKFYFLFFVLILFNTNSLFAQTLEYTFTNEKAIGKKQSLSKSGNFLALLTDTRVVLYQKSVKPAPFEPGSGTLLSTSMPFSFSWKNEMDWVEFSSLDLTGEMRISDLQIDETQKLLILADIGKWSQQTNLSNIHTYDFSISADGKILFFDLK